jgi:hypothetical protein
LNELPEAAERERLAIEERARAEEAIEAYRTRRVGLEHRLPGLYAGAGAARRWSAAIAGSRAWDLLSRAGRRGPRRARTPEATALERERAGYYRAVRRADALERGVGARLASAGRRLVPRRRFARLARPHAPARARPEARPPARPEARVDVLLHCSPRTLPLALRTWRRSRGRGRRFRLVPDIGAPGEALAAAVGRAGGNVIVVVSNATPVSPDWLHRLLQPLSQDPGVGAVAAGSAGWRLDWSAGAPHLSADPGGGDFPGGSCVAIRRGAVDADAFRGFLRGVGVSLAVEARGLRTAWATEVRIEPAGGVPDERDLHELLRRHGPALRKRALRGLLLGGRRALRVSLAPELASLADQCATLGWEPAGDPDVRLAIEDGSLTADWLCSGERFAARLEIDLAHATLEPGALRDALLATIERPSVCVRTARPGGDAVLASSLCRRLARLGHTALLEQPPGAGDPRGACLDAALAIQGWALPDPLPGQLNLVWRISHPDAVAAAELDRYDCVLVASPLDAVRLHGVLRAPVEVMPQFTDPELFFPDPDCSAAHELLFVGNWRGVFRRVVSDALSAGLEPALYGRGWARLAPRHARADRVSPDELRRLYSSCEILLADHWDDMRARGFVSNRLYDALACGAFVICDQVEGIDAELGDAVETYSGSGELRAKVEHWLARPDARRERARRGRELVLEEHTADHRARQLLAAIERLRHQTGGARSGGDSAPRS